MENNNWHSLSSANKLLGKGSTYVSLWLRRHRNEIPEEMVVSSQGKVYLISDEGIEWISNNAKKEGVLVSNNSANEDKYLISQVLGKALNTHFTGWERGRLYNLLIP